MSETVVSELAYTKADFTSDQVVRWCPGCGDYSILAQLQKILPEICAEQGLRREEVVFVSGIGCSSRFPYYMNTYGFHSIHGRAPTFATGIKVTNPRLQVWVITGDGDGLSIGGNHMIHVLRRNVDIKVILFNNRIYGLTKGQYSPTSELGKRTKSSPMGTIEQPINPIGLAIAAEATFVARSLDIDPKHLQMVLKRAAAHRGSVFVEIFQNCNIFNDGTFEDFAARSVRQDQTIYLEDGQPMVFGKESNRGIRANGALPEVVDLGGDINESDLLLHDEHADSAALAYLLSQLRFPEFPVPLGVYRSVERPTYEQMLDDQVQEAKNKEGAGDLDVLLNAADTWTVD